MRIKVMADYECAPLWWDELNPERMGDIRPEALGLSEALCDDLWAWVGAYDATLVRHDPVRSGFPSQADERAFDERGRGLARRVAAELGHAARVRYWRDL